MTHPLSKHHHDISDIVRDDEGVRSQNKSERQAEINLSDRGGISRENLNKRMQEWADDIRKADERCEQFRSQCEQMTKKKS